jgi:hypothetical protein
VAFKLDYGSEVWGALASHLADRLESLRKRNDSPDLDALETATLRGEIAAIKYIMGLGKAGPQRPD